MSDIVVSTEIKDSRKMPCISGHSQSFIHRVIALGKVKFFDFLTVFKFWLFSKTFLPSEILVPRPFRDRVVSSFVHSTTPKFFSHQML